MASQNDSRTPERTEPASDTPSTADATPEPVGAPARKTAKRAPRKSTRTAQSPETEPDQPADAGTSVQAGQGQEARAGQGQEQGRAPAKKAPAKRARKATKKAAAPEAAAPEAAPEAAAPEAAPEAAASNETVPEAPPEAATPDAPTTKATRKRSTKKAATGSQQTAEEGATTPSFGLMFQAPEPTAAPKRRRASSAPATDPAERTGADLDRHAGAGRDPDEGGESGQDDHTRDDDDGEGGGRRGQSRRRRGGKGRRGRGGDDDRGGDERATDDRDDRDGSGSAKSKEDTRSKGDRGGKQTQPQGGKDDQEKSKGGKGRSGKGGKDTSPEGADAHGPGEGQGPADDGADDGESGSNRRRTRRRRRSGSGGEGDDPPGTVTKVREPRQARDEVTSVKGSTRLEAKKQRRREGREAGRRRTVITEAEFLARRESVERVMVVRSQEDRTQIGVLEDGVLVEHYISQESTATMAGNVYLGRVQNVLPSMEAAFVDIGKGRNAVLYAGEVNWDAAGLDGQPRRIEHALKSGESVLAQVTKDPIGHKGARLTAQVSLPGRYLVYVPNNSMTGISRKLPDTERARLKKILKEVVPEDAGVTVRTAAEGASEAELRADVERLTRTWERIRSKQKSANAPALLHGEADMTVRVIRDVFNEDFTKLVVAGESAWKEVSDYVHTVASDLADRLEKWTDTEDLFTHYRVDEALAKAMDRKVWLPSGGSLVIDRTEAMTVVDVNTGKFVGSGGNLEETATKNNIEAAEEIVRQLRLRDIGGILVIDFIDMVLESNRDLVVRRLLECLGRDRTKHQVAEVTSLGLVQMTRKRVGGGLIEVFSEPCAHCNGRGLIVHSEPVDKPADSDSGGNGRNQRGRRGKSGGGNGSSRGGGGGSGAQPKPSGPTAAEIAAAAHAAAVQAGSPDPTATRDEPPATGEQTAAAEDEAAPDSPVRRPRRKRGRVVAPAGPPGGADATAGNQASVADGEGGRQS